MRHLIGAACLQLAIIMTGVAESDVTDGYQFEFHGRAQAERDSVKVAKDGEQTVFVVTNSRGFGGVAIKRKGNDWPDKIVIRFQHAPGKGFGSLESFELQTSKFMVKSRLKGPDDAPVEGKDGRVVPEKSAHMPIAARDGTIEVSIPVALLNGESEFSIGWIDAYR